jgi:hypothetical protein
VVDAPGAVGDAAGAVLGPPDASAAPGGISPAATTIAAVAVATSIRRVLTIFAMRSPFPSRQPADVAGA